MLRHTLIQVGIGIVVAVVLVLDQEHWDRALVVLVLPSLAVPLVVAYTPHIVAVMAAVAAAAVASALSAGSAAQAGPGVVE